MKTKSTLLLAIVAATAMTFAPQTARAGHREDKVFAAVGGLIGGIIIGKNLERHREPAYCPPEPRVIIVQSRPAPPPRGYWHETRTTIWIASCWVESRDECGRRIKIWQPGHYTYQTSRVWVGGGHAGHYNNGYDQDDSSYYARR